MFDYVYQNNLVLTSCIVWMCVHMQLQRYTKCNHINHTASFEDGVYCLEITPLYNIHQLAPLINILKESDVDHEIIVNVNM